MYQYQCEICGKTYSSAKEQKNFVCNDCKDEYRINDDYIYGGFINAEEKEIDHPSFDHPKQSLYDNNFFTISKKFRQQLQTILIKALCMVKLLFFYIKSKKFEIILSSSIVLAFSLLVFCVLISDKKTDKSIEEATSTPYYSDTSHSYSDSDNYNYYNGNGNDTSNGSSENESNSSNKKKKKKSKKELIEDSIIDRIYEYDNISLDYITINEDLGTKKKGDYIALVYLEWHMNVDWSLTKKVLSMYSKDLATCTFKKEKNVQEIAIFWSVPELNYNFGKVSYERKGNHMKLTDKIFIGYSN